MNSSNPSEPSLPDDVNQWPSDERKLFGLASDASRRDLKRAYLKLVRRFKPEHAPQQFRRLREAFESLDQQLEWRETWQQQYSVDCHTSDGDSSTESQTLHIENTNSASIESQPESPDHPGNASQHSTEANIRSADNRSHTDDIEQLWQNALEDGNLADIYPRMVKAALHRTPTVTDYARLYWLLTLHPEFDDERDSTDWLLEGLRRHGRRTQLFMMLSIDVHRRLGNVPSLLAIDPTEYDDSPASVAQFIELRWYVARRQRQFSLIRDDLTTFGRLFLFDQSEWQRLLTVALRNVVLVTDAPALDAMKFVAREFIGSSDTNADRNLCVLYDNTIALHQCWMNRNQILKDDAFDSVNIPVLDGSQFKYTNVVVKETRVTLPELFDLIERTWECSATEVATEVIVFFDRLVHHSPNRWLELASITQVARPLVRRLLELIREHLSESSVDNSPDVTDATMLKLDRFVRRDLWKTNFWQLKIVEFCCKEAVQPYDIAEAIERNQQDLPEYCLTLAQTIRQDLTIICLVEADRLFW